MRTASSRLASSCNPPGFLQESYSFLFLHDPLLPSPLKIHTVLVQCLSVSFLRYSQVFSSLHVVVPVLRGADVYFTCRWCRTNRFGTDCLPPTRTCGSHGTQPSPLGNKMTPRGWNLRAGWLLRTMLNLLSHQLSRPSRLLASCPACLPLQCLLPNERSAYCHSHWATEYSGLKCQGFQRCCLQAALTNARRGVKVFCRTIIWVWARNCDILGFCSQIRPFLLQQL